MRCRLDKRGSKVRAHIRLMAFAAVAFANVAQAGVVVHGTRVVYPSNKREVTVDLHNDGQAPSLVQVWIDDGNELTKGANVPFVMEPSIFRLDPQKGQTLRLIYTGKPLPADRETVFWLNVLDIPPKARANADAPNRLEIAFRHRLKIFFRPAQLTGSPSDAAQDVQWRLATAGGVTTLQAANQSPYDVSLTRLTVTDGVRSYSAPAGMVSPFAQAAFPLEGSPGQGGLKVKYSFVNDYGAIVDVETLVRAGPAPD